VKAVVASVPWTRATLSLCLSCVSWQPRSSRLCTRGQTASDSRDEGTSCDQPSPPMAGLLHQADGRYCHSTLELGLHARAQQII
jgi:hypothetical protein